MKQIRYIIVQALASIHELFHIAIVLTRYRAKLLLINKFTLAQKNISQNIKNEYSSI